MSFVVHFLSAATAASPDPLGAACDPRPTDSPTALSTEEIAAWDEVHPALIAVLPEGSHDVAETRFSRQLVHDRTGLMVTWAHQNYQASLPFWSVNASGGTFEVLARVTKTVESHTGLIGVDEISRARFLDHHAEVAASFGAIADGFEEAMDSQTVLGWVRNLFHRHR